MQWLNRNHLFLLLSLLPAFAGCSKILAYPEVHPPDDGDADADEGLDAADVETDRDAADDGGEDLDAVDDDGQDVDDVQDADEVEIEVCDPGGTWILSFDTDLTGSSGAAAAWTPEGHLVVAASTMNGGIGGSDILVVKVDGCGTVLAAIAVGLMGDDTANDIVMDPDGSFVVAGTTHYFTDSNEDAWIFKLDADLAEVQWQRALAGSGDETMAAMTATAEGRFAVVGTSINISESPEMYVAMIASNGDPVWQETIGTSDFHEQAMGVAEFNDRIIVAGRSWDAPADGFSDAWILCFNKSDGSVHWAKTMDVGGRQDFATDVVQTPTGTILFVGRSGGGGWFGELNSDGATVLYSKHFYTETLGLAALPLSLALIDSESSIAIAGTAVDDDEGLDQMFLATMTGVASPRGEWLALFGRELADQPGSRGFSETDDGLVLAGWSEDLENLWQLVFIKMGDDGEVQNPCPMEGGHMSLTLWDAYDTYIQDLMVGQYEINTIEDPFETTFASTRDMTGIETTFLCPAE